MPLAREHLIQPFSVVIGASSLRRRRSGVGRMTVEIIAAVRHRPELAALRLLLDGGLHAPEVVLERLAAAPEDAPPVQASLLAGARSLIGGIDRLRSARALVRRVRQRRAMLSAEFAFPASGLRRSRARLVARMIHVSGFGPATITRSTGSARDSRLRPTAYDDHALDRFSA
jgi:hypothetical protein